MLLPVARVARLTLPGCRHMGCQHPSIPVQIPDGRLSPYYPPLQSPLQSPFSPVRPLPDLADGQDHPAVLPMPVPLVAPRTRRPLALPPPKPLVMVASEPSRTTGRRRKLPPDLVAVDTLVRDESPVRTPDPDPDPMEYGEIIPDQKFVGSVKAVPILIRLGKVRRLVSLYPDHPVIRQVVREGQIQVIEFNINDHADVDILAVAREIMPLLSDGVPTLVHCQMGISRSAAVVIYYLMKKPPDGQKCWTYQQAYSYMTDPPPRGRGYTKADPNLGFVAQLTNEGRRMCEAQQ